MSAATTQLLRPRAGDKVRDAQVFPRFLPYDNRLHPVFPRQSQVTALLLFSQSLTGSAARTHTHALPHAHACMPRRDAMNATHTQTEPAASRPLPMVHAGEQQCTCPHEARCGVRWSSASRRHCLSALVSEYLCTQLNDSGHCPRW